MYVCMYVCLCESFADRRGYVIEFIRDNNLVYIKPAVIRDKQHYVAVKD